MDINLPIINGMDAARKLRKLDPIVTLVFITNMSQFAVDGYSVDALDFVIKPVSYYNFTSILQKCIRRKQINQDKTIILQTQNGIARLNESDIFYVETLNHKVIYHAGSGNVELWGNLLQAEKMLSSKFVRCNSCYLVNLQFVKTIHGNTVLVGKDELPISRGKKQEFINALTNYFTTR